MSKKTAMFNKDSQTHRFAKLAIVTPPPPTYISTREGVDEESPNVVAPIKFTKINKSKGTFRYPSVRPTYISAREGVDGKINQTNKGVSL